MADTPIENLIDEFLDDHQADFGATCEIHTSAYEKRGKVSGIIIGDAETNAQPNGNDDELTEYDAFLTIEIYARVEGQDKQVRLPARQAVFDLKTILIQLIEEFPTLGGRVCEVQVRRQLRFFDDTNADKFAIERIPLAINPRDFRGE